MDKLNLTTPNLTQQNLESLAALFPSCITESADKNGNIKKSVNFSVLKQLLGGSVTDDSHEHYEFTWVGKRQAMDEAAKPTTETLRPDMSSSRDWDTTQNLYIEGDNLTVLKILQESYLGKVKMIYIDPPYNTGNDFIYQDDFAVECEEWRVRSEEKDEETGNRMFKNTDSNGPFHSDWCSMIYSRLLLARNLLSDDGAIFISIDDNEQDNLKKICDEIFGEPNYVATFPWRKRTAKSDVPFGVSQDYEWIICYAKSSDFIACIDGTERKYFETPDYTGRPWRVHDLTTQRTAFERPNSNFTMVNPRTGKEYPVNPLRTWAVTKETFNQYYAEGKIVFPDDYDFLGITKPAFRYWKEDDEKKAGNMFGMMPATTKLPDDVGMSLDGTKEITQLFNGKIFGFPKTVKLLSYFIEMSTKIDKDAIVLDFFSGSATTAHAVMQLNAEDGGHRKFIMVQLPEECAKDSEAYKAGYKNICEIGEERIRRAGDKIYKEWSVKSGGLKDKTEQLTFADNSTLNSSLSTLDIGFRVFRVDSSNMKDVYFAPEEISQMMLGETVSNIKEGRTDLDLLYSCLLDWGVEINLPHTSTQVAGCTVHNVDNGALMACFDENVPTAVVEEMAKQKPLKAVFRDNSFATDADKINVTEIFKNLSPDTKVKVI